MELTDKNVEKMFKECHASNAENPTDGTTIIEGVANVFSFSTPKLEEHKEEIYDMLKQLPKEFMKDSGGGWSFLNACFDNKGGQWTGLHEDMDILFALGVGIKKVEYLLPREVWHVLPGKMPYLVVL